MPVRGIAPPPIAPPWWRKGQARIAILFSRAQRLEAGACALDQSRNVLGLRCRDQSPHGAALFHTPFSHHYYFVSEASRLSQIVCHEQRGDREVTTQRIERLLKIGARDCVERAERLIEQHNARPRGDAPGESHTLALATGQFMREPRAERRCGKSHQLQCVPRCISGVAHSLQHRNEGDIPQYPPVGQEAAVLLHVAYLSSKQNRELSTSILLPNSHLTMFRLDQAIEAAKKCGFARPTLSDEGYGFSSRNVDADIVERDHVPESMGDVSRS